MHGLVCAADTLPPFQCSPAMSGLHMLYIVLRGKVFIHLSSVLFVHLLNLSIFLNVCVLYVHCETHTYYCMVISQILLFTYSFSQNNIGDTGAEALAGGLQHCTNLQKLE